MMRAMILALVAALAACQSPGYEYSGRAAPNFPAALDYTDVVAGRFAGPAGDVAEREFEALIASAELDGRPWFGVSGPGQPQGAYEGDVSVTAYRGETRYEREKKCVEYDGLFDCEHRAVVERECLKEIVEVGVRTNLVDLSSGRPVFTSVKEGTAEREDCFDVAEYPDTDQSTGQFGPVDHHVYSAYDAPYGLIALAVPEAVRLFRTDIAPYTATFRADIVTKPLIGEEAGDARFDAAVTATKRGDFMGACAQWQQLAAEYPSAPGIQHNWGACAEARGDLPAAHAQYAAAAELARQIPLLKDKDAKPIFDALSRVSQGRYEKKLIDRADGSAGQ